MATKTKPKISKVAQELAAVAGRYPLMFAAPLFFGKVPKRGAHPLVNNGTASIVDPGNGSMIVTARQVIEDYREKAGRDSPDFFLQVGNLRIRDPLTRVLGESKERDLITMRVSPLELTQITMQSEEIGTQLYQPVSWPPDLPTTDDWVTFGGFPGRGREVLSWDKLQFDTYSCGATEVSSVSERHFICQFDRKSWVINNPYKKDLRNLGGLSGGPVFKIISKPVLRFELIGFVTEHSKKFDLLHVIHAKFINQDGTIS